MKPVEIKKVQAVVEQLNNILKMANSIDYNKLWIFNGINPLKNDQVKAELYLIFQ